MAKLLLRNVRSNKRKAALLDLDSITRVQLEKDMDNKVKPALVKSHELIVRGWSSDVFFRSRKVIRTSSIKIFVFPAGRDKKIWTFVDQGTKAHKIRAKRAPTLKFKAGTYVPKTMANPARTNRGGGFVRGGQWRSPLVVNHPGSKARLFSKQIAEDIRPAFVNIIDNSFRLISKKIEE